MRNGRVDESHISVEKAEIRTSTLMTKEFDISGMRQMLNLKGILLTLSLSYKLLRGCIFLNGRVHIENVIIHLVRDDQYRSCLHTHESVMGILRYTHLDEGDTRKK